MATGAPEQAAQRAVVGSITAATGVIRLAGKPDLAACSRISASLGGAEIAEGNNELFVFRREKGAWKIHRYLFSTNQPPRP